MGPSRPDGLLKATGLTRAPLIRGPDLQASTFSTSLTMSLPRLATIGSMKVFGAKAFGAWPVRASTW